jgi:hypothetical protein
VAITTVVTPGVKAQLTPETAKANDHVRPGATVYTNHDSFLPEQRKAIRRLRRGSAVEATGSAYLEIWVEGLCISQQLQQEKYSRRHASRQPALSKRQRRILLNPFNSPLELSHGQQDFLATF